MFRWWSIFLILIIPLIVFKNTDAANTWQKPGCYKVGHTRKISIPGCVEFSITTNACRGFCSSWAIPSLPQINPNLPVTSVGQCCNMIDTEDVQARVLCLDRVRNLTFKSAKSCECYHCKKN